MEKLDPNNTFQITLDLEPTVYVIRTRDSQSWKYQTHCFYLMDFLVESGVTFEEPAGTTYFASLDWTPEKLIELIDTFWNATGKQCVKFPG